MSKGGRLTLKIAAVFFVLLGGIALEAAGADGSSDLPMREVDAGEILSKIQNCQPVEYDHVVVRGDLDLSWDRLQKNITSPIRINDSNFNGEMSFNGTTLVEKIDLTGSNFNRDAYFREAEFSSDASFEGATFSGDTYLGMATFRGDANFWMATFRGDANFLWATFNGDASFRGATFGDAYFEGATFRGDNYFGGATFRGDADFLWTTFGAAYFEGATFGAAYFEGATFSGNANFEEATFGVYAYFGRATFNGDASFNFATFGGEARFPDATFGGDAYFNSATFTGNSSFENAEFNGNVEFGDTRFENYTSFYRILFKRPAYFENCSIKILNLTKAEYNRLHLRWGDRKSLPFDEAAYLALIKNYNNLGWYGDANDCYFAYRNAVRKNWQAASSPGFAARMSNLLDRLIDFGEWLLYGYGVRPSFPIAWSVGIILAFGLFFWQKSCLRKIMVEERIEDSRDASDEVQIKTIARKAEVNAIDPLLFSLFTFTSGFTAFLHPGIEYKLERCLRWAIAERLLGPFFLALVITTISKTYLIR